MSINRTRRALAAFASTAVAAAGLGAVTTSTAAAESASLKYDCVIAGYINEQFTAVVDTDLPDKVEAGSKTANNVTITVTVVYTGPTGVLATLRNLTAATVEGSATAESSVDGAAPVASVLDIPAANVPADGDFVLVAKGAGPAFAPTTTGSKKITAGKFSGTLNFKTAAGAPTPVINSAPITCTPAAGQDLTIDTVQVVKASTPAPAKKAASKTTAKVKVAKKSKKATATVTVKAGKKKATGKVKLKLKKGKKVVGTKTVTLKKGKAKFTFKKKLKKGKYSLTASYKGNKSTKTSKKVVKFRVKK